MTITSKLDECKAAVKQASQNKISTEALQATITSCLVDTSEVYMDLEIIFRSLMHSYLIEDTENINKPDFANTIALLKFSFDFALQLSSTSLNMAKIPFLLMEDVFEYQTINQAEAMWAIVESLESKITHTELFAKGKLVILKMCNSLLRKLSKSCHTEFCGRILLFLAAIYPISERSSVNLPGKINSSNITYIDDADTYRLATTTTTAVSSSSSDSAMKVDGEDGEEVESSSAAASSGLSYELYSSFWKLQSFFASDTKAIDKAETWTGFNDSARKVFSLLENKECDELVSSSSSSSSSRGSNNSGGGDQSSSDETYLGCKYLTSSQLFSLQLKDSTVRQQLAVQVLYFIHYIRAKLPGSLPADNTSILSVVSSDLLFLHNKAASLIQSTKGGQELLQVVQRLISRENHWIAWKASSCPPFEKSPPVLEGDAAAEAALAQKRLMEKTTSEAYQMKKKQKLGGSGASSANLKSKAAPAAGGGNSKGGYQFDCSDANVKEKAKNLLRHFPDFKEHIQMYIDADDPECGIDDEYHPKHDRTRRLLAAKKLSVFQVMPDGNLSKGLRKYEGKPEPVEVAAEEEEEAPAAAEATEMTESAAATAEGEGGDQGEGNTTSNTTAAATPMETEEAETEGAAVAVPVADGDAVAVPTTAMDAEVESSVEAGSGTEQESTTATDSLVGMKILDKEEGEVVKE